MITIRPDHLRKKIRFFTDSELEKHLKLASEVGMYNYTYVVLSDDQVIQLTDLGFELEKTVSCNDYEYKVKW